MSSQGDKGKSQEGGKGAAKKGGKSKSQQGTGSKPRAQPSVDETVENVASLTLTETGSADESVFLEHRIRWNGLLSELRRAVANVSDSSTSLEWTAIETMATEILDDIARVDEEHRKKSSGICDGEDSVIFYPYMGEVHFARADARSETKNFQGAIDDYTQALIISEASGAMETEKKRHFMTLVYRAECFQKLYFSTRDLKHLDEAIVDFRAAWAMVDEVDVGDSRRKKIVKELLTFLVKKRLKSVGFARPLFTLKESRKIEAELKIGVFREQNYRCFECNKVDDKLQLCGGCNRIWFCGKECQKRAWQRHKKACKVEPVGQLLTDEVKAQMDRAEFRHPTDAVFIVASKNGDGVDIISRDPSNGSYFDVLTDKELYFYPSDVDKLKARHGDSLVFSTTK